MIHPHVHVDLDACVGDAAEIRRVMVVELGDLLADDTQPATIATATCNGSLAVLRVDDPITRRSLSRTVALANAYPRTIALAMVELIASSWTELSPPAETAPALPPPQQQLPPVRVTVEADATRFHDLHVLTGLGLRLGGARWTAFAHALGNSQDAAEARMHTDLYDVGAAVLLDQRQGRLELAAGAGLRAGYARMSGFSMITDVKTGMVSAPWLGAFATGAASLRVAGRVTLDASVEAGYVLSPVNALVNGHAGLGVAGPWVAGHVGVGVQL